MTEGTTGSGLVSRLRAKPTSLRACTSVSDRGLGLHGGEFGEFGELREEGAARGSNCKPWKCYYNRHIPRSFTQPKW